MKVNSSFKNLLLVEREIPNSSFTYIDIYFNDEEVGCIAYSIRQNAIDNVEITCLDKKVVDSIRDLIIDQRKELVAWIENIA